ncbi:MAG: hypothetical protein WA118_06565 [Carboxydocellales bacterium]|jgi:hypothetical protein
MINQITTPELLFLGEYLKSGHSNTNFVRSCTQIISDPNLRSFCDKLVREDEMQEAKIAQLLGINLQ